MNGDLMTINGFKAFSTRFVLAQGTHQAIKANFVLLAKENCNWRMPPYHFHISPRAILLQNF